MENQKTTNNKYFQKIGCRKHEKQSKYMPKMNQNPEKSRLGSNVQKQHEFREHARAGFPMEGTGPGPTGRFAQEARGGLGPNIFIDPHRACRHVKSVLGGC